MTERGVTLSILPPPTTANAEQSTVHWLLGVWQVSAKSNWRLWRDVSPLSLELISVSGALRYQLFVRDAAVADAIRLLLRGSTAGVEIISADDRMGQAVSCPSLIESRLALRAGGWEELAASGGIDSAVGLLSVLGAAEPNSTLALQLLIHPTRLRAEGATTPAFWLAGRILSGANSTLLAQRQLRVAKAAFGAFNSRNRVLTTHGTVVSTEGCRAILRRQWPRRWLPVGQPASPAQVATLYHLPLSAASTPQLVVAAARRAPMPPTPDGVLLGQGRDPLGRPADVRLRPMDLTRHALVVGPSGSGKSTLLSNLAVGLVAEGCGITVIDPHGSLAREIARRLPPSARVRAASVRFADHDYPVAFNPLGPPGSASTDDVVEVMQRVFGRTHWGPVLDLVLRHVAAASQAIGGSLADSARLLEDAGYRADVVAEIGNVEAARFLDSLGEASSFDRRVLPAFHRLQRLLSAPLLRTTLGQRENRLDFRRVFREEEVLLCDLSGVGVASARLLGSLLLLSARQAMFSRPTNAAHRPHVILVDEASWFVSPTVAELFDSARKFGVAVVLAVQRVGQLTPASVREAVLGTAATTVAFRLHDPEEATLLHRHFGSERITPNDIRRLGRHKAYVQLTRDDERHDPAWLSPAGPLPERSDADAVERLLIANGRSRFARRRAEVEAELGERPLHSDDPEIRSLPYPDEVPANAA